jgi:hypothetical protein
LYPVGLRGRVGLGLNRPAAFRAKAPDDLATHLTGLGVKRIQQAINIKSGRDYIFVKCATLIVSAPKNCPIATLLIVEIQKNGADLMMKTSKIPREQNPYFLTGRGKKKPWFFLNWGSAKRT